MKTKISRGFRTVVPKKIRVLFDLKPGDSLLWEEKNKIVVVRPTRRKSLEGIIGMISVGGNAVVSKKRAQRGER